METVLRQKADSIQTIHQPGDMPVHRRFAFLLFVGFLMRIAVAEGEDQIFAVRRPDRSGKGTVFFRNLFFRAAVAGYQIYTSLFITGRYKCNLTAIRREGKVAIMHFAESKLAALTGAHFIHMNMCKILATVLGNRLDRVGNSGFIRRHSQSGDDFETAEVLGHQQTSFRICFH